MTDPRQADLDWLYAREPKDPKRPRIQTEPYDVEEWVEPVSPAQMPPDATQADAESVVQIQRPSARVPASDRPASDRRIVDRPAADRRVSSRPVSSRTADAARPMTAPPAGGAVRTSRRRRPPRLVRLLRLPLILLAAWLVWLVAVPINALGQMRTVTESTSAERLAKQPGTAILLVGSDARTHEPGYQPQEGDEDITNARADTIMLLYRPPRGQSVLVSLPRDSYVPIPGYGQDKLNAAYAYGGTPLLMDTVEQVTGVQLDGYLEIGFGGFTQLVDAVGGVEVCPTEYFWDGYTNLELPPGCHQLNGEQALSYVRMRYTDPRGDIGRAERQREVVNKVVAKAARPASVINPFTYWKLSKAMAAMLQRGDQTGNGDLFAAGLGMMDLARGKGVSLAVPISNPAGFTPEGASVVIWDRENALQLFDEISRGDTSQVGRFAG